ncbi:Mus7/MMS22 family-domain-containing protein [Pseudomassariella vexata]|uniref:Mus7/MMS22 family-domain-containing protein n=1 Tax=Pseudomassariella vexata TaxID=1141098 RepID=A0A1Y2DYJ1_9PEZI|nr:Mus7/MMS22 family-domain-containing protein [Pseudomassariella vexata]ORY64176.1 Mus7/MMS22 family-domain-containing protein [Pseudomassariella vexata]
MATWKELGEVPDSDDESILNSEESQEPELPAASHDVHDVDDDPLTEAPITGNEDIWDVPRSSQDPDRKTTTSPASSNELPTATKLPPHSPNSSPLSSAPQVLDYDSVEGVQETGHIGPDKARSERDGSLSPSLRNVYPEAVVESGPNPLSIASRANSAEKAAVTSATRIHDLIPDELLAIQEVSQASRSLRPRKPIQEHPYQLESARYSNILKSHGVRPIRVALEEEARRRKAEEDSQEQDYDEDSQSTVKNSAQVETGESQNSLQEDFLDEHDELALYSPVRHPTSPHRHGMSFSDVLGSSQTDANEDLPSLDEIFQRRTKEKTMTYNKRRGSPKSSSKSKLLKLQANACFNKTASPTTQMPDLFAIPPSPPQTSPALLSMTSADRARLSRPAIASLTPKPSSTTVSQNQIPSPARQDQGAIDLTGIDDFDASSEVGMAVMNDSVDAAEDSESSSSQTNEIDAVLEAGRRIRGVLPASWLRLDRHVPRDRKQQNPQRRSPQHSPERFHRKGVAQRRQVLSKPSNNPFFFDDDSEDDETNLRNNNDSKSPEIPMFSIFDDDDDDDAGSVVEEDHIDRMLPGRKRVSSALDRQQPPKKRKKSQKTFQGQPGKRKWQTKITGLLGRSKSGTGSSKTTTGYSRNAREPSYPVPKTRMPRQATPPRLSIIDVVKPNAPPFIRIAARTANRRPDKGRSSPSSKHISLGTRKDNIDALGTLRSWKNGKIQSRIASTTALYHAQSSEPQPLQPISSNPIIQSSKSKPRPRAPAPVTVPVSRFSKSRKLVRQTNLDNFVAVEQDATSVNSPDAVAEPRPAPTRCLHIHRIGSGRAALRPAQLEVAGGDGINRYAFDAQKKLLDRLYRKTRKTLPAPADVRLEQIFRENPTSPVPRALEEQPQRDDRVQIAKSSPMKTRSRPRKRFQPRCIDTTAPQYTHANDPLPPSHEPSATLESVVLPKDSLKLVGLGPFGTHYTQHFEIFPLDSGVFFHASTIIGDGRLAKALEGKHLDELLSPRGHNVLALGDTVLRWGSWDAQTSSEMGILFDWVLDKLQPGQSSLETDFLTAVRAMDFALEYVQQYLSVPDSESGRHFAKRMLEVMPGFTERLMSLLGSLDSMARQPIEVLTRCTIIVMQTLRICEKLAVPESLQIEELLKKTCQQTVRMLLQMDLADIRRLYDDLQAASSRDRGIQNEQFSAVCWVVLVRTLQTARIPRAGFWDVVSTAMLTSDPASIVDARMLERLWRNLFTLLPLGEFDDAGVAVPGIRHTIPLEGWSLPQKLLSRVFELYKSNQRQSPGFNEYCRGIVSRCHYLVEQWGWRKCNGIVGTIFDFFASQKLSHLRNEEAYKSPQFLEDLAGTPSLMIMPEDRCFHIFLKLLALGIRRLRKFGLIKDMRNLVARVLPNHNRQYLKEDRVHKHELAALRNHHDLLCTLFWSAPADLRPSMQNIEKLIVPGSSHKEACLINLRAWNQLARFIVSSGGGMDTYKPFMQWQNNVFKQVLDQYSSAESDIQQQFLRLSKDVSSGVDHEMVKRVVNMNKQTATDVLHFSLKANLDVIRHAPSLAAASFVINTYQLFEVFTRFASPEPEFDWGTLQAAVDTVDEYLTRIEKFLGRQLTSSESADHWHGEDAISRLDRDIAKTFFPMAKRLFSSSIENKSLGSKNGRVRCIEQVVLVASRIVARFLDVGLSRLSNFFSPGKYCLFESLPDKLPLGSRRYLCLFVANLIDQEVTSFQDIRVIQIELLLCAIVKPFCALGYENQLVETMIRHGHEYLQDFNDVGIKIGISPDYNSNRDLFNHVITKMRQTLRNVNPSRNHELKAECSKAIRAAMEHMKQDLKSMTLDTAEHANYIQFMRSIISIIKTNDICPVDQYFYQISREYSPSAQDPGLHTATILSFGLKLEDGNTGAVSGLFFHLYFNFKLALSNDKLSEESAILVQGMRNPHVFSFVLNRMFPAIIQAAIRIPTAWLLMTVYVDALEQLLTESCVHREIGEESMPDVLTLLKSISTGIQHLRRLDIAHLQPEHLHIMTHMTKLVNLIGPSMEAYLCMKSVSQPGKALTKEINSFTDFTRSAADCLSETLGISSDAALPIQLSSSTLLGGIRHYKADPTLECNAQINNFVKEIMTDIPKNWVVKGSIATIRGPARPAAPSSTQSGMGTTVPVWNMRNLASDLYEQIMEWNADHDVSKDGKRTGRSNRKMMIQEEFLF